MKTLILAIVMVFALACPASADQTPGVVTVHEFNHAQKGWTRAQVTKSFGTHGHVIGGNWIQGRFILTVKYHGINGPTFANFVDRGTTGDNFHLRNLYRFTKTKYCVPFHCVILRDKV